MPGLSLNNSIESNYRVLPEGLVFTIGREMNCHISLPHPEVSRVHATIEYLDGKWIIKDQSRNGILINRKAMKRHALQSDDELSVGPFHFTYHLEAPPFNPICHNATQEIQSLDVVGSSKAFQKTLKRCKLAASRDFPILVHGETGTGKELISHFIHQQSSRRNETLLCLNCATFNTTLMESELFGYERGAFTGAHERKMGIFEAAQGGSLFFDEVGEIPLELQAKLLRVLEEKQIRRLGSNKSIQTDVRIITATNRDIKQEVFQGRFREDLYHRLNIFPISIPALRERISDIPPLAIAILKRDHFSKTLAPEALERLKHYTWPGNIRELRNILVRSALISEGEEIQANDLELPEVAEMSKMIDSHGNDNATHGLSPVYSLRTAERDTIREHLEQNRWNRARTAKSLGIARSTLFLKMRKLGFN